MKKENVEKPNTHDHKQFKPRRFVLFLFIREWEREKRNDAKHERHSQQLVNNVKSPLMAHKLSCLTSYFAQLPIHHAITNTYQYTYALTWKCMENRREDQTAKLCMCIPSYKWHEIKWYALQRNRKRLRNVYVLEPKTFTHTKLLLFISIKHNAPEPVAEHHKGTYTWIACACACVCAFVIVIVQFPKRWYNSFSFFLYFCCFFPSFLLFYLVHGFVQW